MQPLGSPERDDRQLPGLPRRRTAPTDPAPEFMKDPRPGGTSTDNGPPKDLKKLRKMASGRMGPTREESQGAAPVPMSKHSSRGPTFDERKNQLDKANPERPKTLSQEQSTTRDAEAFDHRSRTFKISIKLADQLTIRRADEQGRLEEGPANEPRISPERDGSKAQQDAGSSSPSTTACRTPDAKDGMNGPTSFSTRFGEGVGRALTNFTWARPRTGDGRCAAGICQVPPRGLGLRGRFTARSRRARV